MGALIQKITEADGISLADAASALALPPGEYAIIPTWWNRDDGCISEIELEVWADDDLTLTAAELFSAMPHAITFADLTISAVTAGADTVTSVAHGRLTGDGPVVHTTAGTVIGGLELETDYWIIKVTDDTFSLALSLEDALAGTAVDISGAGTGTRKIVDVPGSTERLYWHSNGLLGPAGDGEIVLTATRAHLERGPHSPRSVAYAMAATFGDAVTCSAKIYPLRDR